MEVLDSNIKKIQEMQTPLKKIPYISGNGNAKSASNILGKGIFQSTPRKFLIFQEKKTLKKFLIFSQKKAFLISPETKTSKKFFIFQEMELCYISGTKFPCSKNEKTLLFYFEKMGLSNQKLKKLLMLTKELA